MIDLDAEWARLNEQGVYLVEFAGVPDALIRLSKLVELSSDERRVEDFVRRVMAAVLMANAELPLPGSKQIQ